jgi:periplasmic protein TonB
MLAEFSHHDPPPRTPASSRAVAALLTIALYALFVVLVLRAFLWAPAPPKSEIVATLLPDIPKKREKPSPPVLAHMIRPHAESPAPPTITIAPAAPQKPAPLPATTVLPSPMQGGSAGNGIAGQSGNGGNGNGAGSGGCLDPVWMRAVTDRVRQVFYYPGAALASRITGVAMMHFVVRKDGKLDRLEIAKSSGDAGLDKAALDIMQRAQPLPPIPERMHTDRVDGELPINFGVRSFTGSATAAHC